MRRVIHINDNIRLEGGVEVYVEQLTRLLPAYGWETDWFGVRRKGNRVEVLCYGKAECSWKGNLRSLSQFLQSQLKTRESGLLHVHNVSDPKLIRASFTVGPVVRTMHEPRMFCPGQGKFWNVSEVPCEKPFGFHCLVHAYTQKCCNRHPKRLLAGINNARFEVGEGSRGYANIIANSHFMKKQAVLAGIPEHTITVLPCFTEEVPLVEADLSSESKEILFSGRLSKTKGVHYLLQAFALVREKMPDAKLSIAGEGNDRDFFLNLASNLGISQAVTFHGWCNRQRLDCLTKESCIVAFPSICPEAFGLAGIEAMMRGRPVVAFNVGGVREWLHHGVTGILAPFKDVEALAAGLLRLLSSKQSRVVMGGSARARALLEFSSDKHLKGLVSVYESAVAKRR